MKKALLVIAILALLGTGGYFVVSKNQNDQQSAADSTSQTDGQTEFIQQIKSAHFESSTPEHGATLAGAPGDVVIDFNFDLAKPSAISIKQNDTDYSEGETTIDGNQLAMRRQMKLSAPNGVYVVDYTACWPDGSCHDGQFSFAIDRDQAADYIDMRGQAEVAVRMNQIKFSSANLRISKGTKITWVNDDAEIHYVNTDSHPAHTHLPTLNSQALQQGGSYSQAFNELGLYPYHCSAHASQMKGNILVE